MTPEPTIRDFTTDPDWVTGLRWGGTENGGGNLWLTTADGDQRKFRLDNNTTNVLLRALLADATIRIEASGQVVDSR